MPRYEKAALALFICAGLGFAGALFLSARHLLEGVDGMAAVWAQPVSLLVTALFLLVLARGIRRHETWARVAGILVSVLSLPAFPIGTVAGAYTLWALATGWKQPDAAPSSAKVPKPTWLASWGSYGAAFALTFVLSVLVTNVLPVFLGLYAEYGAPVLPVLSAVSAAGPWAGLLPVPVLLLWLLRPATPGRVNLPGVLLVSVSVVALVAFLCALYYPIFSMG